MCATNVPTASQKLLVMALVLSVVLWCLVFSKLTVGQDSQDRTEPLQRQSELVPPGQEKRLYMKVRPQIPLKFKVSNLNSKRWAHDLEIEVTNTSGRPIYFFHFYVTLPEVKGSTGSTVAFWKHYGRGKLLDLSTPLEPDDVPLLPGEKYVFTLSETEAKAWDYMKEKEGKPEPKAVVIEFQSINFGDGTGYDDEKFIDSRKKINFNEKGAQFFNHNGAQSPNLSAPSCRLLAFLAVPANVSLAKFFCLRNLA